MKTFKITSSWFPDGFYIPVEANMKYLNSENIDETREIIFRNLCEKKWLKEGGTITLEEIESPRENFNWNLFKGPNFELLCFLGFSYPRYFNGKKIHYECSVLYEFGTWDKNENHYYTQSGEFLRTEILN